MGQQMSDWLHNLPIPWMALVIFGGVYLLAFVIYTGVLGATTHKRIRSFKAISAGMLSPLGVVFGLFVVFTAAQVWQDNDRANTAVSREATALRSVLVLAASFPGEPENKLRSLVREYVQQAATVEWPMMAHRAAALKAPSPALVQALQLVLSLTTAGSGQEIAQREIVSSLGRQPADQVQRERALAAPGFHEPGREQETRDARKRDRRSRAARRTTASRASWCVWHRCRRTAWRCLRPPALQEARVSVPEAPCRRAAQRPWTRSPA